MELSLGTKALSLVCVSHLRNISQMTVMGEKQMITATWKLLGERINSWVIYIESCKLKVRRENPCEMLCHALESECVWGTRVEIVSENF